jgi:hypothetical protein
LGKNATLQLVAAFGVLVDDLGDIVGQLDDAAWPCNSPAPPCRRSARSAASSFGIAALDAVVQMNDMQHVEQLALVFVDALDLHVEHGIGVELHAAVGFDQGGQMTACCRA